ncbi:MAG TPA: 4a-hydroxytetrahydrobiopterin dehydratase [Anaerolineales bacterium]|nr:4a-hydroxytetrahydrobiopterin dehydratase [Anaerolineales bacterium]
MKYTLLSPNEIAQQLEALPEWQLQENTLCRQWTAENFAQALQWLNAIAYVSERLDHHPDLHLHGWKFLSVRIFTHVVGGLTTADFALAHQIDTLMAIKN